MKSFFNFIVVLLFLNTSINTAQVTNYEYGDVVDDFTVTDVNGDIWNLYDITSQGKYVYLDFFFADCVPCQLTQPIFNEVYDTYGCNSGDLFMISINDGRDTNAEVIAYKNEYGGPFNHAPAVGMEGGCEAVANNFGIIGYPSYLLISPDNIYLSRLEGALQDLTVAAFEESFPADFNPELLPCNLGIVNTNEAFDFKIVPNPSDGKGVNLILNNFHSQMEVIIYNILGQKLYSRDIIQDSTVLEPNLSAGSYFIQLIISGKKHTKILLVE